MKYDSAGRWLRYLLNILNLRPPFILFENKSIIRCLIDLVDRHQPSTIIFDNFALSSISISIDSRLSSRSAKHILLCRDSHSLSLTEEVRCKFSRNLLTDLLYYIRINLSRIYEKRVLPKFNNTIFHSNYDARYINSLSLNIHANVFPVVFEPSSLDEPDFSHTKIESFKFITIAPLAKGNLQYLMSFIYDTWDKYLSKYPKSSLTIVSSVAVSDETLSIIKAFNIHILPFQPSLRKLYASHDIVLSLVRKRNGMINKVLEGFAFSRLVIGYQESFTALEKCI